MESLRIPILKIGNVLIASIQTTLHDSSAVQFKDDLLQRIFETRARGLIVDLTQLEIYINVTAELEYLQSLSPENGGIRSGDQIDLLHDLA